MSITEETRREAFWRKEEFAKKRQSMICNALEKNGPMTAEELTQHFGVSDKNFVKPRLTELFKKGILEKVGVRKSLITDRNTTVWAIKEVPGSAANTTED